MKNLCIYHSNCNDGFGAAWVVKTFMPDTEFVAAQYGQDPPDVTGRDVWIVDFSYKRDVMEPLIEQAKHITVLDHHKTAEVDLQGLLASGRIDGEFDMERSGAAMTWDWFGRKDEGFSTRPRLIEYIQDRDLWHKALPHSDEVSAWLYSHPYCFDTWNTLRHQLDANFDYVVVEGEAIMRAQRKRGELAIKKSFFLNINGKRIPVTHSTDSFSEIASKLAEDADFGACFFLANEGRDVVFSLRSTKDGDDVSEFARQFGGGGHEHAAGFTMSINNFALYISRMHARVPR